jgi:hypothetical protein
MFAEKVDAFEFAYESASDLSLDLMIAELTPTIPGCSPRLMSGEEFALPDFQRRRWGAYD